MVLADNQIGVIDFQDAVIGPITYDVVSLLRDCYVAWPEEQLAVWLQDYYQRLLAAGLVAVDYLEFKRWFDLMGMQRHLKAIGIFSRLHLRDGKSGYLADIPRTLNYVIQVCGEYPAFSEFGAFLQATVLPAWQKNT
jgi:aminoglycoside/choline kinase family phosphotransferase